MLRRARLCMYRVGDAQEISVPSCQFCCELKTALKHKFFQKTLKNLFALQRMDIINL
jgi:hypothetical protein